MIVAPCLRLLKNNVQNFEENIGEYAHECSVLNNWYKLLDWNIEDSSNELIPAGVYATKSYKLMDVVHTLSGKLLLKPTKISIHVGSNMHIEDAYGQFINHSFTPNVVVSQNKLIALRDIEPFEEITFNYNDTEINMANPFECDGIWVCGKNEQNEENEKNEKNDENDENDDNENNEENEKGDGHVLKPTCTCMSTEDDVCPKCLDSCLDDIHSRMLNGTLGRNAVDRQIELKKALLSMMPNNLEIQNKINAEINVLQLLRQRQQND